MPKTHAAASELTSLLDGSSAGALIPELARQGLQKLIELEFAAFLGADWHERSEERLGYRNGYRPRTLTTQVGDLALQLASPGVVYFPGTPPRRSRGGPHTSVGWSHG
jgi:transposase-like protein